MMVTVLTPAVAEARGWVHPELPGAYVVAAPDGLFFGPSFEWAKAVAFAYDLPVSFL